ncbi:MAG: hydrolase, HAD-superfamily, subfamily [Pseudonocardiales bacterium]|nr:hydrolase, HAD-superfamily, subfamily [Pseudonocardiales bacterium]
MSVAIVIATIGRPSLTRLLIALAASDGPRPDALVLVDDRRRPQAELVDRLGLPGWTAELLQVRRSGGRGPAAARNVGWRSVDTDWVVFLDDDVRVTPLWLGQLAADLQVLDPDVAASQGRISVPRPPRRRPTDWERGTAGLETASWITADIAYRRAVLRELHGFDERFRRAYREDADLALRALAAGYRLTVGQRRTIHPVRPAPWWASIAQQRGNADDALMRALHGAAWHRRVGAVVGRRPRHLATTAAGLAAVVGAVTRRRRLTAWAAASWIAATAEFTRARIAPGPRSADELARMLATSAVIPPVASWHWLDGLRRYRRSRPWPATDGPVDAVLVDRDGTIVRDVPYNGEPALVEPMPGARAALDRLRAAGIRVGVITNQSGIARGQLTMPQVTAVNARVDELLGPFADWQVCPHGPDDGCSCRKPRPGMVVAAARALGVDVRRCLVVGDTGADVAAARAAGADAVLVPNDATRREEIAAAPRVFRGLTEAVDALLRRAGARR